jgi:hypothetical protein
MNGNKDRIIGTEWDMGFGQVASIVALMTVVYAIVLSYQDYLLKLKERKQNEESDTTLPHDHARADRKDVEMAFVAL